MNKILCIAILTLGLASSVLYGCERSQTHIRYTNHPTIVYPRYSPPVRTMNHPPIIHRSPITVYRPNPMNPHMRFGTMPYKTAPVMPHRVMPSPRLTPVVPYRNIPSRPGISSKVSPIRPHSVSPSRGNSPTRSNRTTTGRMTHPGSRR